MSRTEETVDEEEDVGAAEEEELLQDAKVDEQEVVDDPLGLMQDDRLIVFRHEVE